MHDIYGEKLGICIRHINLGCHICRKEERVLKDRDMFTKQLGELKSSKLSIEKQIIYVKDRLKDIK